MLSVTDALQMELINECSMRFAEDKDFRLLVRIFLMFKVAHQVRSWTPSWPCFESTSLVAANLVKGNKRYVFELIESTTDGTLASTSEHDISW